MISRRSFIALASGLLVPGLEPIRAYSFVGGWRRGARPLLTPFEWRGLVLPGEFRVPPGYAGLNVQIRQVSA